MNQRPNLPKNPLLRDGVSQRQRLTPALSPDGDHAAQVDERNLADFLASAYHLSEQVHYYPLPRPQASLAQGSNGRSNGQNGAAIAPSTSASTSEPTLGRPTGLSALRQGHWQAFFKNYTPVQIALISKKQTLQVKRDYDKLLEEFLAQRNCETLVPILMCWQKDILKPIHDWYDTLASYTPLRSMIRGLVNTNLTDAIAQVLAFEQTCVSELDTYLEADLVAKREAFYRPFIADFGLPITPEQVDSPAIAPPLSSSTIRDDLDGIFQDLFQVYRQIIHKAPTYLDASLSDRRDHPPHIAMYVAMLDVLQPARDDLNRMTQRHLDFFYRKVLALPARPSTPDYAHLLFELAKQEREYKLSAGTRFKAGKDDTGVELFYALDQDMVVHKASIASLKGLFLDSAQFPEDVPTDIINLWASPVANSADGQGGEFPKEQAVKAWLPFGGPQVLTSQTAQVVNNPASQGPGLQGPGLQGQPAQLGVAIASDVLLLQEGIRNITLVLSLNRGSQPLEKVDLKPAFELYFSGEKEWILATAKDLDGPADSTNADSTNTDEDAPATIESVSWNEGDSTLTIEVKLTAEVEPILPYDPENPIPFDPDAPPEASNLPLTVARPMPVVRLQLTSRGLDDKGRSAYHYFRDVMLTELTLITNVPEVRNLVVQTDAGVQDATKPFQPFGPRPKIGSTLYIGSEEVLGKRLSELTLHLTHEDPPPTKSGDLTSLDWEKIYVSYDSAYEENNPNVFRKDFAPETVTVESLRQKVWHPGKPSTINVFSPSGIDLTNQLSALSLDSFAKPEVVEQFTPNSQNGFLRLQLKEDFLHDEYPTVLARQVLAAATNQPSPLDESKRLAIVGAYYQKGKEPAFEAKIRSVDPEAEAVLPKEPYTPVIRSVHLSYTAQAQLSDCQVFQLYPFGGFEALPETITDESPYRLFPSFTNEGELLIGIADLDPPTALPLLFQVAEETADTGLRRTEEFKPQWFYLKDNTWVTLSDRISSDTTNGLIRSGIVNLGLPEDISNAKTTILDPTLHWVKVSMPARTRTVCHIIGVHPQAARVTFANDGNDPNHLAQPLPAGAIAKLENPQAAIKGIEQPYASVEGRVQEPPSQFYTRVSEHLRHKGRAVTIFDYERLVLEQFPDIYKVRCLNHGQFDDATNELFELAPGAVTLAVIPDLSQRRTTDDLQPKVNINRLNAVETYLTSLSSSWASIRVVNPQYEPIRVTFDVKFQSPFDANFGYYRRELERAIVGFLTPWTVDQGADIHFGGRVYRSAILNFVEEQEYVDYVVNFQLFHNDQDNIQEAIATTARSVLTSVPYDHPAGHVIKEYKPPTVALPNVPLETGILGYEPLDNLVLGEDIPDTSGIQGSTSG